MTNTNTEAYCRELDSQNLESERRLGLDPLTSLSLYARRLERRAVFYENLADKIKRSLRKK